MKRLVLITGSMGYVGSRMACFLASQNELSLRLCFYKNKFKLPIAPDKAEVVPLDLIKDVDLSNICKGVDTVIHLASLNKDESESDSSRAFNVNVEGTIRLLKGASLQGVKKFIYFSTAHVYGKLEGNITETTLAKPISPYAITHKEAEEQVLKINENKKPNCLVLRLSNGFGAPINKNINCWSLVINNFCMQAATKRKIILQSDSAWQRDFITLEDICRATLHFLMLPGADVKDDIFNIGGENVLNILEVANLISLRCTEVLGFTPQIIHGSFTKKIEAKTFNYVIDKLKSTGFTLKGKVYEEIDNTLKQCIS